MISLIISLTCMVQRVDPFREVTYARYRPSCEISHVLTFEHKKKSMIFLVENEFLKMEIADDGHKNVSSYG